MRKEGPGKEFFSGFKDCVPLMVGVLPLGLVFGIVATQVGLSVEETYLMSALVFAGAAQFTALELIRASSTLPFIVLMTLLINSRHFLMAASLLSHLKGVSRRWRALLAFGMTDESYATTIKAFTSKRSGRFYFLGSNMAIYSIWSVTTIAGATAGGFVGDPFMWGLDFAMPATFIVILVALTKNRRDLFAVFSSAVVSLFIISLFQGRWYILVAALAGTLVGGTVEELWNSKTST